VIEVSYSCSHAPQVLWLYNTEHHKQTKMFLALNVSVGDAENFSENL